MNILRNLRINRVASVDKGAGKGVEIVLMKRDEDPELLWKAKYDTAARDEMAGKEAMADGSYPVKDAADLENAIHAVGRGKDSHAAIRAHITTRAKALGLSDKLPDSWGDGGKMAKAYYDALRKAGLYVGPSDETDGAENFSEVLGEQELNQQFWDDYYNATNALQESVMSIIKDDDATDKQSLITESITQFADHIGQILPGDIGKSLAAGIAASAGTPGATLSKGDPMNDELKKALGLAATATDAEVLKAVQDNSAALVKAAEDLEKAKKPVPAADAEPDADDMAKALVDGSAFKTPQGRIITKKLMGNETAFELAKSQNDTLVAQGAELAKAREVAEESDFAKRATDAGLAPEFTITVRKAFRGDAAAQDLVLKDYKARDEQDRVSGVFKNFGTSATDEGSAQSELMAKADEIRKANPTLSKQQAYARATDANPEIFKRVKAEASA